MKKYEFNKNLAMDIWGFNEVHRIAEDVFTRLDDEEECKEDAIFSAADDSLIYTADQWALMQFYQTPRDANFEEAFEMFLEDLYNVIDRKDGEIDEFQN